jgi:hypothetical protein
MEWLALKASVEDVVLVDVSDLRAAQNARQSVNHGREAHAHVSNTYDGQGL